MYMFIVTAARSTCTCMGLQIPLFIFLNIYFVLSWLSLVVVLSLTCFDLDMLKSKLIPFNLKAINQGPLI